MKLEALERGTRAQIVAVEWTLMAPEDATRLRALGIDQGARVSVAHRGVFSGRDPLAVTVGRMTVAVRRRHAAAIEVEPL